MIYLCGTHTGCRPTSATNINSTWNSKKHWHRSEGHVDLPSGDTDHHDTQEHMLLLIGRQEEQGMQGQCFLLTYRSPLLWSLSIVVVAMRGCWESGGRQIRERQQLSNIVLSSTFRISWAVDSWKDLSWALSLSRSDTGRSGPVLFSWAHLSHFPLLFPLHSFPLLSPIAVAILPILCFTLLSVVGVFQFPQQP